MPGNSFGQIFRLTTFGESHGGAVGGVLDGCPPGVEITEDEIQIELDRRKPGQSDITSPRKEEDRIKILSGVFEGKTTGTPILLLAQNKDTKSEDYNELKNAFRPGHADFTYIAKYGMRDWRGSGRASARETLARVAAGAIAKKILGSLGISSLAYVEQVGQIKAPLDPHAVTREQVEANLIRCPDQTQALSMIKLIEEARDEGDSLGGIIRCIIKGVPAGLGEPVFDKLHSDLGAAMLSINAVKGFDIGSGFEGVTLKGSEHNDLFRRNDDGTVTTQTNNAGGILGGISTGSPIVFRVAFKPVSTIRKSQDTVSVTGEKVTITGAGRHDPCVLPRAVPIVEAMANLVIADHWLRQKTVR